MKTLYSAGYWSFSMDYLYGLQCEYFHLLYKKQSMCQNRTSLSKWWKNIRRIASTFLRPAVQIMLSARWSFASGHHASQWSINLALLAAAQYISPRFACAGPPVFSEGHTYNEVSNQESLHSGIAPEYLEWELPQRRRQQQKEKIRSMLRRKFDEWNASNPNRVLFSRWP